MKKVNNKLAMTLLRGVVALSGLMVTGCVALFTESWNSLFIVGLVGITIVVLIDEHIKN